MLFQELCAIFANDSTDDYADTHNYKNFEQTERHPFRLFRYCSGFTVYHWAYTAHTWSDVNYRITAENLPKCNKLQP